MQKIITPNKLSINFQYISCSKPTPETVLFVHGLGLDMSTWDEVVNIMKADINILRYDLREHGKKHSRKKRHIYMGFIN